MEIWKAQCHYDELYVLCCLLIAWNGMPADKVLWIIIELNKSLAVLPGRV